MSVSPNKTPKIKKRNSSDSLISYKMIKRETSLEKPIKHLSLKNTFYMLEPEYKINQNLTILSYIANSGRKNSSAKTTLSKIVKVNWDYDFGDINKFDEKNTSLSSISEFDLEEEEKRSNDSFDSCEYNDISVEEIQIITKTKKRNFRYEEEDSDFEKDWNEIQKSILKKETLI